MKPFRHITYPFRVFSGADSLGHLASELDRLGCRRALVFCGRTLARSDALKRATTALDARCAGVFDGVQAHSPIPSVLAGADALRAHAADAVIAVGGGSAVVTARASTIVYAEGGDIDALCTRFPAGKPPMSPRLDKPKLPQLVVATTPTTAYAKAGSAVLDPERGERLALFDPKTRAAALFLDPAFAATAPVGLFQSAGFQALAMAVQGLESRIRDPLADALLIHALCLLARDLQSLAVQADEPDVRVNLMLGALLAGQGTDYAPPGLASALAHTLGARLNLDNGVLSGLLLPHAMRFNASATRERGLTIANALGIASERNTDAALAAAIERIEALLATAGLPRRLRDLGVSEESLGELAEIAARDWFLHQNPRPVSTATEIAALLSAAW
jgi:alcohol dehydrogenase